MIKNYKMENHLDISNEIKTLLQNNLIFCPSCNTHLTPYWMNLKDIAIICGNQYVKNYFNFLIILVSFPPKFGKFKNFHFQ